LMMKNCTIAAVPEINQAEGGSLGGSPIAGESAGNPPCHADPGPVVSRS
jgi:hypothetical protein